MGIFDNSVDATIQGTIKLHREKIDGLLHYHKSVSEPISINFLNDIHDCIYKRLKQIDNEITFNGYLTTIETDKLKREVNKLDKCLQVINNLLKIDTL